MKQQNIVDVIVYMLERVVAAQSAVDQAAIKRTLEEAGFTREIITYAFDWLKELIEQQHWYATSPGVKANRTLRIFNREELSKINVETRGFILSLEYVNILDTKMREIVINQLMQLNQSTVDIIDAKWVVLLVLMSKSNRNVQEMHSYLLTTMAQEM